MDTPSGPGPAAVEDVGQTSTDAARRDEPPAQPDLSVCVPTYRRPALMERAVRSAMAGAAAAAARVEILVSDNSPEESEGAARALLREWPGPATYIANETDIGLIGNLNQCRSRAAGRWVLILHDDDYLQPGGVDAILEAIDSAEPSDHVLLFGTSVVDEHGHILRQQLHPSDRRLPPSQALRRVLTDSSYVRFPAVVVRRSAYEDVGPFSAEAAQATDFDMWIRLFAAHGVRLVPRAVSAYTVHPGALTSGMFTGEYVGILAGCFQTALDTGVLEPEIVRRSQRDWFHQFLLAGAYRSIRQGDTAAARRVLKLFDVPTIRALGRSRHWLLIRAAISITALLPSPVARTLARVVYPFDREVRSWVLDPERA
ncbi:MAG: glycosyltransferase family 2 protein [Candidatus Limnocylindrales bacterium]